MNSTAVAFFIVLSASIILLSESAAFVKRNDTEKDPKNLICQGRLPCGWFVYSQTTRIEQFFLNNTCSCSKEKQCIQTDDDLSVGAYVFRCIVKDTIIPQ